MLKNKSNYEIKFVDEITLKNKIIDDVNDMVRLYGGDENAL